MFSLHWGRVKKVINVRSHKWILLVDVDGKDERAVLYPRLTGEVKKGDYVLLNTTAVELKLGTGGYHFVLVVDGGEEKTQSLPGHIMKLRYTPYQIKVLAREEKRNFVDHSHPIVIAILLHSMLPAVACILKYHEENRVAFVMTDGGALPLWFSDTVYKLEKRGMIQTTITTGHSFGGREEAVNIYSGLLTAAETCNVIIAGPGPGHVGTNNKWGFTGLQQGEILNAAGTLGYQGIGIPRISFADKRKRHYGISHHSITSLGKVCRDRVKIFLPQLAENKNMIIREQAKALKDKEIIFLETEGMMPVLEQNRDIMSTMGRELSDDPEYFLTCAAGGLGAAKLAKGGEKNN